MGNNIVCMESILLVDSSHLITSTAADEAVRREHTTDIEEISQTRTPIEH